MNAPKPAHSKASKQKHDRRTFLRTAGLGAVGLSLGQSLRAEARSSSRPNIVLIMADDMGYSDLGCYGGEIQTPNLDKLGKGGLRFTQFYNNAKCAPTRASLLTGLYSQQVGIHNPPRRMANCVTIAEVLRSAGYRTLMTGKWHADQLPVDRGFDRYYGLADGCCNYFNPGEQRPGEPKPAEKRYPRKWAIDDQVQQPYTPADPNFYTTDAFTDYALAYLDRYGRDERPFFLYIAYTAPHYPLHAWPEDIAKYRGKYLVGWDAIRQQRFERMVRMGLIDERWGLAPRDARVPPWTDIENRAKWDLAALQRRGGTGLTWESARDRDMWDLKMAVYAAMVDRMDQNIGRIMAKIRDLGKEDNTLVLFLSDNGGCAELIHLTQDVPPGPVNSYRSVDPPWANAQNTPFRKYKRWDHEGGISTPLIAYWPNEIKPGQITHQVGHVIDVMATCIDLAAAEYPSSYNGEDVRPLEGKSLLPILRGEQRAGHDALFWQFGTCRAVRAGKWKLVGADSPWELYDMVEDRTELHDLADAHPQIVREMARQWRSWAQRCAATK